MNFTFPKNYQMHKSTIKVALGAKRILRSIDITKPWFNTISINNIDYFFTYLNFDSTRSKGGNSVILKLYRADDFDTEEINYEDPDKVLKILKFDYASWNAEEPIQMRFKKEIEALKKSKQENLPSIISIHEHGFCKFRFESNDKIIEKDYQYYTMEPAQDDLSSFLENNPNLKEYERATLCLNLAYCLKDLYNLGYYHRDLKPDNILFVSGEMKIADLGLIEDRDANFKIDKENELIGPRGWLSPEALNKKLCAGKVLQYFYDCEIDHQSDIFQLGKIFCFILQGNNPMGNINLSELNIKNIKIKQAVHKMLYFKKKRRLANIQAFINRTKPVIQKEIY